MKKYITHILGFGEFSPIISYDNLFELLISSVESLSLFPSTNHHFLHRTSRFHPQWLVFSGCSLTKRHLNSAKRGLNSGGGILARRTFGSHTDV